MRRTLLAPPASAHVLTPKHFTCISQLSGLSRLANYRSAKKKKNRTNRRQRERLQMGRRTSVRRAISGRRVVPCRETDAQPEPARISLYPVTDVINKNTSERERERAREPAFGWLLASSSPLFAWRTGRSLGGRELNVRDVVGEPSVGRPRDAHWPGRASPLQCRWPEDPPLGWPTALVGQRANGAAGSRAAEDAWRGISDGVEGISPAAAHSLFTSSWQRRRRWARLARCDDCASSRFRAMSAQ